MNLFFKIPKSFLILICFVPLLFSCATSKPVAIKNPKWEPAMQAFALADRTNPPPRDAIFFIGSSSFTIWKTLAEDLPDFTVVNRGFGGSQLEDSSAYVSQIVLPHKPKAILLYAGDNDIASGKTALEVFTEFKRFVQTVHRASPRTKIIFVSIKPSPSRWKLKEQIEEANRLIKDYCHSKKNLSFIDIFTPMLDAEGKPREDIFRSDRLHMNQKGYAIWIPLIRKHLTETLD